MKPYQQLDQMFDKIVKEYVEQVIIPFLAKRKWVLYCANGAVGCANNKGDDVSGTKTFEKFEDKASQAFSGYYNTSCSPFWDILCHYPTTQTYGPYNIPCLDYTVKED